MNQLVKSNITTPFCKICFKDIHIDSLHSFISDQVICNNCLKTLDPKLQCFKINDIDSLSLYDYNEELKKLIFLYKGNKDYELKDVFLSYYKVFLKYKFKNYEIIYVPSFKDKVIERGFDHVRSIYECLNLKENSKVIKLKDEKQSSKNFKERQDIKGLFKIENPSLILNKNILLVDDVCTTGSTLKEISNLIKKNSPKDLKILVIAKRNFTKEELKHIENKDFILK